MTRQRDRVQSHLHGHAHGSDERRAPYLVVPPEQMHVDALPVLDEAEAERRGLLTVEEAAARAGLTVSQVRSRILCGRLEPVAHQRRASGRARDGRPRLLFTAAAVDALST